MPDKKITALTAITQPTADDLFCGVNDPSGSPETVKVTRANLGRRIIEPTAKSGNYILTSDDEIIKFDATGAARNGSLPTAVGAQGKVYIIVKIDSSANIVYVNPNGAETISGGTSYHLVNENESVTIVSDNSNWIVIGAFGA